MFQIGRLEKQTCSQCKSYLSCLPVKVYASGETKCGRCVEENDDGVPSLFNNLAQDILFPCINRFEGCLELISTDDVTKHEAICKGSVYACPLCRKEKNYRKVLDLIDHVMTKHHSCTLSYPTTTLHIKKIKKTRYFYYNENRNIFIAIFMFKEGNELNIVCSSVRSKDRSTTHRIKLLSLNSGQELYCSPWKICSLWNDHCDCHRVPIKEDFDLVTFEIEFEPFQSTWKWKSTQEETKTANPKTKKIEKSNFPKIDLDKVKSEALRSRLRTMKVSEDSRYLLDDKGKVIQSIWCTFCESYWPLQAIKVCYECTDVHCGTMFCIICKSYFPNNCIRCYAPLSEKVYEMLTFYCRYNCGESFMYLIFHEQSCPNNFSNHSVDLKHSSPLFTHKTFYTNVLKTTNNNFQAYVEDQRGFKYELTHQAQNGQAKISILHHYDLTEYSVKVNVYHNNQLVNVEITDWFTVDIGAIIAIVIKKKT
ncbi:hypothetical protein GWI33_001480 [Rhynchophorus ferrugineus]|uniref:SIAH-type domain-containing protein n=1 Tax=Rhynchophorus ferrugineus TaxID=354439 RepID=A0A834ISL3_RHYFE|nr:hypothetical protein GWI33_001480 [Rhynchophorus ferrugineus]